MSVKGKVFKYGNNVDTDVIIPARYLNLPSLENLKKHCMEDIDKDFASLVNKNDIIVAQDNFGCGSSREHAPLAIKASGVSIVIAKSFARIFYRNAINIGLAILECEEAVDSTSKNDVLECDLETGTIYNLTTNKSFKAKPYPKFLQEIIEKGGLLKSIE